MYSFMLILQKEVAVLQAAVTAAHQEIEQLRGHLDTFAWQHEDTQRKLQALSQECSRLSEQNHELRAAKRGPSRAGTEGSRATSVSIGSIPSSTPFSESDKGRPPSARQAQRSTSRPQQRPGSSKESEDDACTHSQRRHTCAACALGASVSNMSFGIIPPEIAVKPLDSPMSAWRSKLHGPIVTRPVPKPRSAPSSPARTNFTPVLPERSLDDSFRSASTGIVGIEMMSSPSAMSVNHWTINGPK